MIDFVSQIWSPLTVVAQIAIVALLILIVVVSVQKKQNIFSEFIKDNALWLSFVVALAATLGSLFYSEILKYEPCSLCWYQRILMYPQVIILGLAAWKKDSLIIPYSIALSLVGGAIAAFHYYGQTIDTGVLSCDVLGQTASCATLFIFDYGYITIPMQALTAFGLITLLMVSKKLYNK